MAIKKFNSVEGFSVGDLTQVDVIDANANVLANNLTVTAKANLGGISNITITGGTANYLIQTDGSGNLTFVNPNGIGLAGSNTQLQFNDNGAFGASANLTFNKSSNTLTVTNISVTANGTFNNVTANTTTTNNVYAQSGNLNLYAQGTDSSIVLTPTGNGIIDATTSRIINVAEPVNDQDAATKKYVDDVAQGLHTHDACQAATPDTLANITSGTITYNNGNAGIGANLVTTGSFNLIDGVNVQTAGTRILVKNEANTAHNGIYVWSNATVITRADDFNTPVEMAGGDFTFVQGGTLYDNTGWVMPDPVTTVGTSAVVWVQFSGAGTYTAGVGLLLNGTEFYIANTGVSNGSYGNGDRISTFTVNDRGQLTTASSTPVTANAANLSGTSLNSNIVSSNLTSLGTLTSLSVSGNITSGNANLGNLATANYFSGDGSLLSNLNPGNIGLVANANYAAYAGNVVNASQPNITSVGTLTSLSVTGNITSGNIDGGNLSKANYFQGNGSLLTSITGANVTGTVANANYAAYAGNANTANTATTAGSATTAGTVTTNAQPNITSVGTLSSLTVTGNISSGNANLGNAATANFFIGDGSLLSNLNPGNIGLVANANYAAYAGNVTIASQPNITSLGTLTSVAVTGNANVGNLNSAGSINGVDGLFTGNLTVNGTTTFINVDTFRVEDPVIELGGGPNGSALSSNDGKDRGTLLHYYTTTPVDGFMGWDNSNAEFGFGKNVSVTNDVVTWNEYGNIRANIFYGNASQLTGTIANANYSLYAGTVLTNAQPNITSVGTLSSLNVSGNVTSGNANLGNLATANYFQGDGSLLSNLNPGNIGLVANANYAAYAGNVITASQPNITSVGTLTNLSVLGNITSGNANLGNTAQANFFVGNGSLLTAVNGANVTGTVPNANYATYAGTVLTNAQPNITSVGTLSSLTVTGNITSGNANLGNAARANFFVGDGGYLSNINPANIGTVANANYATYAGEAFAVAGSNVVGSVANANYSNFAGTAYSVSGGNVSGSVANANYSNFAGTAYSVSGGNVSGSVANANYSNFAGTAYSVSGGNVSGSVANANYSNFAGTAYSVSGSNVSGTVANANYAAYAGNVTIASQPNITSLGTLTGLTSNGTINFINATNVSLGSNTTIKITGGTAGYMLVTDGVGNLSWVEPNIGGGIGGTNSQVQFNDNGVFSGSSTFTFNKTTNTLSVTNIVANGAGLTAINGSNVTGTVANANYAGYAGNVINASQPNITSLGTLTSLSVTGTVSGGNLSTSGSLQTGDATITGNLTVNGTTFYANVSTLNVKDPIIEMGGNPNGTPLGANDGKDRGTLLHYYSGAAIDAFMGWKNANSEFVFASNANVSSEIISVNQYGNVRAGYFFGNASQLVGTIANANYSAFTNTVIGATQSNITAVGTLTGLTSNGTVNFTNASNVSLGSNSNVKLSGGSSGYILTTDGSGNLSWTAPAGGGGLAGSNTEVQFNDAGAFGASGNFTFNKSSNTLTVDKIVANGSQLSSITGGNVTGQVANALIASTVYTSAQPNITSVGTLSSLSVSGNITSGNIDGGNLVKANYFQGTLTTASQPNITSIGTLSSLSVSGNITAGNIDGGNLLKANYVQGDGSLLTNVTAGNISGAVANANYATYAGTVLTNAQPNITSVGALSSLAVVGNLSSGNANLGNLAKANYFQGDGSLLTNITGGNVNGQVGNALIAGTVYSSAQPNITSVGSLTGLTLTGNLTGTYANFSQDVVVLNLYAGNLLAANYFSGDGNALTNVPADGGNATTALYAGYVTGNAQPNITSVGTLTSLVVANSGIGNITADNANLGNLVIANYFQGNGSLITYINGANVVGTVANANYSAFANVAYNVSGANVSGSVANANYSNFAGTAYAVSGANVSGSVANANYAAYAGNVINATQSNITSVGTLTSLTVNNTIVSSYAAGDEGGEIQLAKPLSNTSLNSSITIDIYQNKIRFFDSGGSFRGAYIDLTAASTGVGSNLLAGSTVGPGGANSELQFNDNGSFGGNANLTFNKSTSVLTVTGNIVASNGNLGNLVQANYFQGNGSLLTSLNASNITGTVANANYAAFAGNVINATQSNITSVGTLTSLSVSGNATISGNLTVTGNMVYANVTTLNVKDPVIEMGGDPNGSPLSSNDGKDRGTLLHYYVTGNSTAVDAFMGWDNSNAEFGFGSNVTNTNDVMTFNNYGNVRASYFLGNGSQLTGTIAFSNYAFYAAQVLDSTQSNITTLGTLTNVVVNGSGSVSGANLVSANFLTGTLTTSTQSNIRTVGVLTGLESNGTVNFSNATTVNLGSNSIVKLTGGTAGYLLTTDGSGNLSWSAPTAGVAGSNQQVQFNDGGSAFGASANFTFNKSTNTLSVTNITANGAGLTNINGANVTGTVANANFAAWSDVAYSVSGSNVSGAVANANYSTYAGTVLTNAQPNITSVGTLSSLSVTGNITGGNANLGNAVRANFFIGDGGLLSNLNPGNIGTVANANYALYAGTVLTASQPNITSVGTLSSLSVTGNITSGNIDGGNLVKGNYVQGTLTTSSQPNITSVGTLTGLSSNGTINFTNASNVSLGSNSNVKITGGTSGYLLTTDGTGNLTWSAPTSGVAGSNTQVQFNDGGSSFGGDANFTYDKSTDTLGVKNVTMEATGTLSGGNLISANYLTGTLTTSAQPNITSVGTLQNTTLGASNSLTGGNLVSANYLTGTLTTSAQPNITSIGSLTSLTISGTGSITGPNLISANYLTGTLTTSAQPNITSVGTLQNTTLGASNSLTGGNLISANYLTGTLTTAAQPNITSVGTLTSVTVTGNANVGNLNSSGTLTAGDATITGNLTVNGTTIYANVTTLNVKDPIIEMGGNPNGTPLTSNDGKDRGTLLHYYSGAAVDAFMGWDNSNAEFGFGSNVTNSSEVMTFNSYGNIRAGYYFGNASQLEGTIANANYAAYAGNVMNATQSNITSLGNLTTLNVSATVNATSFTSNVTTGTAPLSVQSTTLVANLNADLLDGYNTAVANTANTVVVRDANGNISANYIQGNGAFLTGVTATPAGSNTEVQFNDAGSLGSNANFTFNKSTSVLTVTGNVSATYFSGNGSFLTNVGVRFTSSNTMPMSPQVGDEWYDRNTDIIYKYIFDGTVYTWIDTSSSFLAASTSNTANTLALRDANGNIYANNFVGTFASTGNSSAGNMSISGVLNVTGNITTSNRLISTIATGNAPIVVNSTTRVANLNVDYANVTDFAVVTAQTTGTFFPTFVNASSTGNRALGANANINVNIATGAFNSTLLGGTLTTAAQPNVTSLGNLTGLTVNASGVVNFINTSNVSLGSVSNLKITGGSNGFVLKTDGTGNLSWATDSANAAGSNTQIQFNDNGPLGGSANLTFDKSTNNLTLAGNLVTTAATPGNITGANWVIANYFSGAGNALSNIQAANVSGTIGAANVSFFGNVSSTSTGTYYPTFINASTAGNYAPFTNSAFSFNAATGAFNATLLGGTLTTASQPNITSVGTLSSLSVTGNITAGNVSATTFTGALSGAATTAGTVTTNAQPNITSVGTLTGLTSNGTVNFTGASNVSLGSNAIVRITGGISGQVLQTDGTGTLTWATVTGNPGGSNTFVQFNDGGSFGGNTNLTYDKATSTLTANNLTVNYLATFGNVGNVKISGGVNGYVLTTDGSGNLSWAAAGGGSGTAITNGTSNVNIANPNGNITVGVGGVANVAVFTSTGVELGSNANVKITGGSVGQALTTDGSGNLIWATAGAPITYDFDDISTQVDGFTGTFPLEYNQDIVSSITDPYSILVTVNGAMQAAWVWNTDVVWQNFVLGTKKGYTIITSGYITFADPPPAGSDVLIRTYTGSQNSTTKKYPFSAADIMLGF